MAVTGRKTRALHHLRTALANQSSFQTWVGAENAEEALASIVLYGAEEDELPDRPFVIMRLSTGENRSQVATSTFAPAPIAILVIAENDVTSENQGDFDAACDEASDDWDALRGWIEDCNGYEVDSVRLFVSGLDEVVEDDQLGGFVWPDESELAAGSGRFPWWQARMQVTLGGTGEI